MKDKSFRPTAQEVRELREAGLGMREAVRVCMKAMFMEACQEAKTVQDLSEIMFRFIEETY